MTAGGRRLQALQELAAEGVIPAACEIPCLVEEPDSALEISIDGKYGTGRDAPGRRIRREWRR